MVAYNGKHIILEIPQHRILCNIRDNQKIRLGNGIVPKNLNQVILALIESWVYLDPSKRADLINVTLDSGNDSDQEEDLSEYVKSYPISDEQVMSFATDKKLVLLTFDKHFLNENRPAILC
jgi:hypothetical protein